MTSSGSTPLRKVLPGLLIGLSALLSGCVADASDETTSESEGVVTSSLSDHVTAADPGHPSDPGAGMDPEPDPWKGGGRRHDNTDPEPDPWHPAYAAVAGSGSSNTKP